MIFSYFKIKDGKSLKSCAKLDVCFVMQLCLFPEEMKTKKRHLSVFQAGNRISLGK